MGDRVQKLRNRPVRSCVGGWGGFFALLGQLGLGTPRSPLGISGGEDWAVTGQALENLEDLGSSPWRWGRPERGRRSYRGGVRCERS